MTIRIDYDLLNRISSELSKSQRIAPIAASDEDQSITFITNKHLSHQQFSKLSEALKFRLNKNVSVRNINSDEERNYFNRALYCYDHPTSYFSLNQYDNNSVTDFQFDIRHDTDKQTIALARLLKNHVTADEDNKITIVIQNGDFSPAGIIVSDPSLAEKIANFIGVKADASNSAGDSIFVENFIKAANDSNTTLRQLLDREMEYMRREEQAASMEIIADPSGFRVKLGGRPTDYINLDTALKQAEATRGRG